MVQQTWESPPTAADGRRLETSNSIEFCAAPEVRRGAYYALASLAPLAVVGLWVGAYANTIEAQPVMFILVLAGGSIAALRWKVRIDERGVSRRFLCRWDVWTWNDIASGRIEKRHPRTLVDPRRPWWRRRLSIGLFMSHANVAHAMALINTRYRLPPPPKVPAELQIRYGLRRQVWLDANGVRIVTARDVRQFLWSDVRRIHLTRADPLRRDFQQLEISLPDREIEFSLVSTQHGTSPSWRGPTSEVLNEFIIRHVAADRIDVDISGEPLVKQADIEKRLSRTRKASRAVFW